MSAEEQKTHWRIRISPEVSLADILAVVGIGVPILIWGAKMDHRVDSLEKGQVELAAEDRRAIDRQEAFKREMKEDLREITKKLDSLIDRLPSTNGKPTR